MSLSLSDNHTDLRSHGILQLFSQPHPARGQPPLEEDHLVPDQFINTSFDSDEAFEDIDEEDGDEFFGSKSTESDKIILPNDLNPLDALLELENMHVFQSKTGSSAILLDTQNSTSDIRITEKSSSAKNLPFDANLKVLGCLLVELYQSKKYVTQQQNCPFQNRLESACQHYKSLPANVRMMSKILLYCNPDEEHFCLPVTIENLTNPLSSPISFPDCFPVLIQIMSLVSDISDFHEARVGERVINLFSPY